MTPKDLIYCLRSMINPAYSTHIGTENYERRICAETIDEMLIDTENCHAKYKELFSASHNLCVVNGRHNSEIAMRRLMDICGVVAPNCNLSDK